MCIPLWMKNDMDAQQLVIAVMFHYRWFRCFEKPTEEGYKILSRMLVHLSNRITEEQKKHEIS